LSDNKLSSNTIYPGQALTVPAKVYTVQSGDTLYKIAKKYNISLTSLRMANHIWTDSIVPGKKLLIPGVKPSSSTTTQKTVIPYTGDEVNLLARLITAEATGEPYSAMVAVGGTVVNRVQSSEWPNTITDVIYQVINGYYQFTPVKNGYINNAPSDDAVKAAWDALYGKDPSNGAQFYFDDSSTNSWLWSRPVTAELGHMVFVK
jgi:spore germination cell wall hydrolase CwlJ-like protein